MSANSGYSSGGQNLTVHGHGFGTGNITAKVDGKDCLVSAYQADKFSCEVAASSAVSTVNAPQPGSHGIRRNFINKTTWLSWSDLNTDTPYDELLATQFETPYNIGD
jgi:hypothetical protein